jgi:Uma2 family endonuclease
MSESQGAITAEEFAGMRQDDDWKEELHGGRIHRTPPASARHGIACAQLAQRIGQYCHETAWGVVSLGGGLVVARDPDSVFAPDLARWSVARPPDIANGWPRVPPVLIAEVIDSVSERSDTMYKMPFYLELGVDLVWLVGTIRRVVEVHRLVDHSRPFDPWEWRYAGCIRHTTLSSEQTLDGGDVLPGFSCKVADLFG